MSIITKRISVLIICAMLVGSITACGKENTAAPATSTEQVASQLAEEKQNAGAQPQSSQVLDNDTMPVDQYGGANPNPYPMDNYDTTGQYALDIYGNGGSDYVDPYRNMGAMPENADPNYTYVSIDGQWVAIPLEEAQSEDFDVDAYLEPYMPQAATYITGEEEVVAILEVSAPNKAYEKLYLTPDLLVKQYEIDENEITLANDFMTYYSMQTYMDLYEYRCSNLENFDANEYSKAIVPWVRDLIGSVAYPESVLTLDIRLQMLNSSAVNAKFLADDSNPAQGIIVSIVDLIKNLTGLYNPNFVALPGNCQMLVTINDTPIQLKFETVVTVDSAGTVSAHTPEKEVEMVDITPKRPTKNRGIVSMSVLSVAENEGVDTELTCRVKYTNCPGLSGDDEIVIVVPSDESDDAEIELYGNSASALKNQVSYMSTYFDGAPNPKRTEYVIEIAQHQCEKYKGKYFVISNDIAKPPVDVTK